MFEQSLWDALPQYLRAVDRALDRSDGHALPRDASPFDFGSWIGGDRDGNPSITPEVTRQATWLARWQAADLYLKDITRSAASCRCRPRTQATSFARE